MSTANANTTTTTTNTATTTIEKCIMKNAEDLSWPIGLVVIQEEQGFIASAKGRYEWGPHPYTQNTVKTC